MCDCDLCNINYGIGQLLTIYPIILLSGIVAVFTQQHFFSGFIGCCCLPHTSEYVSNECSVIWQWVKSFIFYAFLDDNFRLQPCTQGPVQLVMYKSSYCKKVGILGRLVYSLPIFLVLLFLLLFIFLLLLALIVMVRYIFIMDIPRSYGMPNAAPPYPVVDNNLLCSAGRSREPFLCLCAVYEMEEKDKMKSKWKRGECGQEISDSFRFFLSSIYFSNWVQRSGISVG